MNTLISLCRFCEFDVYKEQYQVFNDNNYRPDFVIVMRNMPCKSIFCSFIVELQLGNIDNDHKGRVIMYNQLVLRTQPIRETIVSALTNLEFFILMETRRNGEDYIHRESIPMSFWDTVSCLHQMLRDANCVHFNYPLSFYIENREYIITRFLGKQQ